jgi:hypothetical protein
MSKWFCSTDSLSPLIKMAAFDAGYLIAKNNPDLNQRALPIADAIVKTIDGGGSNDTMNAVFQQAVQELLAQVSDPLIQASIVGVLSQVKFDPKLPNIKLDNETIHGLVDSFVNGMKAVK